MSGVGQQAGGNERPVADPGLRVIYSAHESAVRTLLWGRPELVSLRPTGGEIYAHLFENSRTGVARNLFWNLRIDCEPVHLEGEEWDCSVAVEWLRWTVPNWRSLDAKGLRDVSAPEMVEASVYLVAEHHTVAVEDL